MQDAFEDWMDAKVRALGGSTLWFDAKVAGTTHPNADGSSRQAIARTLQPEDELLLVPEPANPFDPHAIAVLSPDGAQVGYLEARLAAELTRRRERGIHARCFVRAVRQGHSGTCGISFGLLQYDERMA